MSDKQTQWGVHRGLYVVRMPKEQAEYLALRGDGMLMTREITRIPAGILTGPWTEVMPTLSPLSA